MCTSSTECPSSALNLHMQTCSVNNLRTSTSCLVLMLGLDACFIFGLVLFYCLLCPQTLVCLWQINPLYSFWKCKCFGAVAWALWIVLPWPLPVWALELLVGLEPSEGDRAGASRHHSSWPFNIAVWRPVGSQRLETVGMLRSSSLSWSEMEARLNHLALSWRTMVYMALPQVWTKHLRIQRQNLLITSQTTWWDTNDTEKRRDTNKEETK